MRNARPRYLLAQIAGVSRAFRVFKKTLPSRE